MTDNERRAKERHDGEKERRQRGEKSERARPASVYEAEARGSPLHNITTTSLKFNKNKSRFIWSVVIMDKSQMACNKLPGFSMVWRVPEISPGINKIHKGRREAEPPAALRPGPSRARN